MLTSGTSLGPYRLIGPIGAGGMGEVYRARDTRLERDVAIKVLPAEVSQDRDRSTRFEIEAKALAALSHPNILVIHDFGREGEVTYAVTELLDGETLRQRITKGAIPWREAVEIGAGIADGLSAAHSAGIVHRDLKPENVFITRDGRVKVLDFGLAKAQRGPLTQEETVTSPPDGTSVGTVLGTIGYMAPEQVRGEPADQRSDIFAFGCVLYEMLTGSRAFGGNTPVETLSAILKEQPQEIIRAHPEISPELDRIVAHCLEKTPERRCQSAHDLAFDLRSLLTSSVLTRPGLSVPRARRWPVAVGAAALVVVVVAVGLWAPWKRFAPKLNLDSTKVVVLPFENRTGDPALDSFGLLIPEAVTRDAALVEGMTVLPVRTSTAKAGDFSNPQALTSLARANGAGLVVSGVYYLAGDNLQIETNLFDAEERSVILNFDPIAGRSQDRQSLLEPLRQRVLGAIACAHEQGNKLGLMHTPTLDAFVEYRRGSELFGRDYPAAMEHLSRAAALDPDFLTPRSLIWASLYNQSRCEEAAKVLADIEDHSERLTPLERLSLSAWQAHQEVRVAEALGIWRQMEKMVSGLDIGVVYVQEANCLTMLNRPREAVAILTREKADQTWSGPWFTQWWPRSFLAGAYHMLGDYEAELKVANYGVRDFPDILTFRSRQAAALAALGRVAELDRVVDDALALRASAESAGSVMRTATAELRAHGNREAALKMAERAVAWYKARPSSEAAEVEEPLLTALIQAERLTEAKALADTWLAESPDDVDRLGTVGVLAARLGDRARAQEIASKLRDRAPDCYDAGATAWRAGIAAWLGDKQEGMALLKEAMARGFVFYSALHSEIELAPLWDDPEFKEFIRPKG